MQKNSCDIIIPVWDQLKTTQDCIESITRNTAYPYRLMIVDNGSGKETRDYLDSLKAGAGLNIELIRNEKNLGFVKAVNQGMKASSAPYICLMNNDTIATDGWLEEMVKIAEAGPEVGIVNPSSNTFGQDPCGGSIEEYAAALKRFAGRTQELYAARGFCMLIKRDLIERIGPFDEIFSIGYFEETDFSYRAQAAGFSIVRAKGAYVYHRENVSFKELKDSKGLFAGNEKIFFERWGRPVRVGYFADNAIARDKIEKIAESVARSGHQIFIFLKKGIDWPVALDHINIRRVDVDPLFFCFSSVYSVFKRKNKKKLEILLTDNKFLGNILSGLRSIHDSEVIVGPDVNDLLQIINKASRRGVING